VRFHGVLTASLYFDIFIVSIQPHLPEPAGPLNTNGGRPDGGVMQLAILKRHFLEVIVFDSLI